MRFSDVYPLFKDDIALTALSHRVPGLDYDDVVSEMTICLWQATETWVHDHGVSLGSYWWSLWLNRKAKLLAHAGARKRGSLVPVPEYLLDRAVEDPRDPDPPQWCSAVERLVWQLLATGEPVKEVVELTGMSRRGYYTLLGRLRTPEVRRLLTGE